MKKSYIYWFVILWLTGLVIFWFHKAIAQNSNLNLVVTVTPQQYLSLSNAAFNRGTTISNLLVSTNMGIAIEIRQRFIQNRIQNAFDKFRDILTDQQKEQVILLIESF